MNDNAALNLIKNTFENSFDRERFLIFAKNLFHFLDTDSFIYRGNLIPDAYDAHIKTLERLGKYEDVDGHKIEVLAVCLNKQSALERARTLQRNFIAWYLNGSRGGITKDAALVAFYTKDSDDWRLSLVKMDYHLGESKAGKIKAITELTPARRFSFLVGANENTHTAQRQLLPILKDTDFKPALSDFESAFSVEVVTKDFFEKYKKLFLDTKDALDAMVAKDAKIKADFQEKNIDTTDFAKKLLGQIVFLYFLQKKGWFGVERGKDWGTGSKTFLRDLFSGKVLPYDNFFNDVLESLFYDALARDRSDVDYFNPQFNCKIPFLNGGLFDPLGGYDWTNTDIYLPNNLFSNKKSENDEGSGILDIFDLYNFTVKEDEPLEREVAVDPEMLGKVFENLLDVKDRKSKGTYYTPREIVHYMCQESLVNYLLTELEGKVERDDIETLIRLGETAIENEALVMDKGFETKDHHFKLPQSIRDNATLLDEKLEKIHVCDPAVGSGAFLVGMMTEVIRVRNILTKYLADNDRSTYDFKRHAIQNCLYGVDIDPGAVEIAKLRLWLSLIVDEQDIKQIKPLPNLDYKIMQGNSLLEEYEGIKLFDEGIVSASPLDNTRQIEEIKQKLSELQREFIKLHSAGELKGVKKQQIEAELKKYNDWLNKLTKAPKVKADNGSLFDQFSQAKQKSDELKKLHQEFFETANKREKDEIKKKIEVLEWELIEATLREQNKLSLLPEIERFKKTNIKPFFLWKLHFSEVFQEKGGFDIVIGNPPYGARFSTQEKQVFLRLYHNQDYQLDSYLLFLERGFELLHIAAVLAYIIPNPWLINLKLRKIRCFLFGQQSIRAIVHYARKVFDATVDTEVVIVSKEIPKNNRVFVRLVTNTDSSVDRFVEQQKWASTGGDPVNIFVDSNQEALIETMRTKSVPLKELCEVLAGMSPYEVGKGTPRQTRSDVDKRIYDADHKKDKTYRPLLRGRDIDRYVTKWDGHRWIKYGPNLAAPRRVETFDAAEKIVIRQTGDSLIATLDSKQFICMKNMHTITQRNKTYDLKFILGLLNSRLLNYYFQWLNPEKGEALAEIKKEHVANLVIKATSEKQRNQIIEIVDKILAITKSSDYLENPQKKEDVKEYEKQIDQLVYKLYGLTLDEIKIVKDKGF